MPTASNSLKLYPYCQRQNVAQEVWFWAIYDLLGTTRTISALAELLVIDDYTLIVAVHVHWVSPNEAAVHVI